MKLLFLCVANSARSQMAEGIAKKIFGDSALIQSAGSQPSQLNPLAVQVLHENGIDISQQHSKSVSSIAPASVETVITLCAEEVCPVFLGNAKRLHWPMPDPAAEKNPTLQLQAFRQVRDELVRRITDLKQTNAKEGRKHA